MWHAIDLTNNGAICSFFYSLLMLLSLLLLFVLLLLLLQGNLNFQYGFIIRLHCIQSRMLI